MKRRLMAWLLAAMLLLGAVGALAEDVTYIGDMTVVNCEEWVSLREAPSTSSARLKKVPLGATVFDAAWEDGQGDFMYCCYDGVYGYILSQYLTADTAGGANVAMDETVGGLRLRAERGYIGEGEYLLVTCEDDSGAQRWFYETATDDVTELTMTDAFVAGFAQDPLVMVYNAQSGLVALDVSTGEARWSLSRDEANLGASISHASRGDGLLVVGGYYGPDPVAIDGWGNVLWRADSGDCAWLYEIELRDDCIAAHYDLMEDGGSGWVYYGYDGRLIKKENE